MQTTQDSVRNEVSELARQLLAASEAQAPFTGLQQILSAANLAFTLEGDSDGLLDALHSAHSELCRERRKLGSNQPRPPYECLLFSAMHLLGAADNAKAYEWRTWQDKRGGTSGISASYYIHYVDLFARLASEQLNSFNSWSAQCQ
jgi:hypothetical protein